MRGWRLCANSSRPRRCGGGLGQAGEALGIGDEAVSLWRLAEGRWPQTRLRLDSWRALERLAAVGRALLGDDRAALKRGGSR